MRAFLLPTVRLTCGHDRMAVSPVTFCDRRFGKEQVCTGLVATLYSRLIMRRNGRNAETQIIQSATPGASGVGGFDLKVQEGSGRFRHHRLSGPPPPPPPHARTKSHRIFTFYMDPTMDSSGGSGPKDPPGQLRRCREHRDEIYLKTEWQWFSGNASVAFNRLLYAGSD